jgi:tetratricopeptide (TPR) repeat protein
VSVTGLPGCRDDGPARYGIDPVAVPSGALRPVAVGGVPFELLWPGAWFPAMGGGEAGVEAAGAAFLAGDAETAEAGWVRGLETRADRQAAAARLGLALLAALRGDPAGAADALAEVERAYGPDDPLHVLARLDRGAALAASGRPGEGEAAAAESLRAARRIRSRELEGAAAFALAMAALTRGRRNAARSRLREALRIFTRGGVWLRQVQCHHLLGEIAYEAEDPIKAGSHYRDGLALARAAEAAPAIELLMLRFEHR